VAARAARRVGSPELWHVAEVQVATGRRGPPQICGAGQRAEPRRAKRLRTVSGGSAAGRGDG
jgi:hypothetical protein